MDTSEFRKFAHELADWMADYLEQIESYPVKPAVQPGEIRQKLPDHAPGQPESFPEIFSDFREIILPGMTHWQHPSFFAYFPANSSPPSVLAEMLTAALAAQCMIWQTSPAATELEEVMMRWLAEMIGLPDSFTGVIQDTASTATLCSLLTAREKISSFGINHSGLQGQPRYIVYCSEQTHSSIDKAVRIAGLGSDQIRKAAVDEAFAMRPSALREAIETDLERGYTPLAVVATLGTTGSTAIDPLEEIGNICRKYGIWLHVDAAFAGTALLLPEMRSMLAGIEAVDTFVFNPHKWMFTNFDCSAYFVRDKEALIRTFEILPEYLKTKEADRVNNYRDWGIALGRRFRALKLWFVIRSYGVEGLRSKLRNHLEIARWFAKQVEAHPEFEQLAPAPFNLICFRWHPSGVEDPETLNRLNAELLERLNRTGKMFLSHTRLKEVYTIRIVFGQTYVEKRHAEQAWQLIRHEAHRMQRELDSPG